MRSEPRSRVKLVRGLCLQSSQSAEDIQVGQTASPVCTRLAVATCRGDLGLNYVRNTRTNVNSGGGGGVLE